MGYIAEALMGRTESEIAAAIREGVLRRYGGVLRIAKGHEGAGQIAAHLRDVTPSSQIAESLAPALQMSQVAAAASVLNLGVSVVGFAIMARKLDRLQTDMGYAIGLLRDNHEEVRSKLNEIDGRLVELRYIGLTSASLVHVAIEGIRDIRKDHLDSYFASMAAQLLHLDRRGTVTDAQFDDAWKVFTASRLWMNAGLEAARIVREEPATLFDMLLRYRGWCFAVAAEVQVARRAGELKAAADLAREAAETSRRLATRWAGAMLPPGEFGGVHRLGLSGFASVPLEVKNRLSRLQDDEEWATADVRGIRAAEHVARVAPKLPPQWYEHQRAAVTVLDFVEEATERLESLREETEFTNQRRLGFDRWEALPVPLENNGLAIIRIQEAA